jgi:hypothetical protein
MVFEALYPIDRCLSTLKVLLIIRLLLSNRLLVTYHCSRATDTTSRDGLLSIIARLRPRTTSILKIVRIQNLCVDALILIALLCQHFLLIMISGCFELTRRKMLIVRHWLMLRSNC